MQWPGTTGVLEGASGAGLGRNEQSSAGLTGTVRSGTGPSTAQLSSKVYSAAELPCREEPELFFAESPEDVEFAKSLCGSCAVRMACLAGAMARAEPWGVWGGELFLRGEIVPRKRPRGRPRKDAVAA
jgi:WhiB family transcriptional regulator, redox-sensing transcriptional regulator